MNGPIELTHSSDFSSHNVIYGSKRGRRREFEASALCSKVEITASKSIVIRIKSPFYFVQNV